MITGAREVAQFLDTEYIDRHQLGYEPRRPQDQPTRRISAATAPASVHLSRSRVGR